MAPVFEVSVEVLEVEQVGAVVGCMLCEYKSVYLDEEADGDEGGVWEQYALSLTRTIPSSSLGVQKPATLHEEQGPRR